MIVYSYDRNLFYSGKIKAQKNPMTGGDLMPSFSTEIKPPSSVEEGKKIKYDTDLQDWIIVDDQFYINEKLKEVNGAGISLYKRDENNKLLKRTDEEINQDIDDLKIRTKRSKFLSAKRFWEDIFWVFSYENIELGTITDNKLKHVADAFRDVNYYMSVNAHDVAMNEIDNIQRDDKYLTDERLNKMKNDLLKFISEY